MRFLGAITFQNGGWFDAPVVSLSSSDLVLFRKKRIIAIGETPEKEIPKMLEKKSTFDHEKNSKKERE